MQPKSEIEFKKSISKCEAPRPSRGKQAPFVPIKSNKQDLHLEFLFIYEKSNAIGVIGHSKNNR